MNRRIFLAAAVVFPLTRVNNHPHLSSGRPLNNTRLGASTACLANFSLLDAIREIRQLGFSTIEIIAYTGARHSVGEIPGFDFHTASKRERELVFQATRSFRHISAHMPFQNLHLFSSKQEERQASVDRLKRAMDGLAYLKGEIAVVHAGWPDKGMTYQDIWQQMVDTFRLLGDYAGRHGLKIGLETMQPNSVREYTDLIFEINHPKVGAAIDSGHIQGATDIKLPAERRDSVEGRQKFNEVLNRIIALVGEKIVHVHLSDVRGSDWRDHQRIGTGIIDFPRLFRTLRKKKYEGLMVLELEEPESIRALQASKSYVEQVLKS